MEDKIARLEREREQRKSELDNVRHELQNQTTSNQKFNAALQESQREISKYKAEVLKM